MVGVNGYISTEKVALLKSSDDEIMDQNPIARVVTNNAGILYSLLSSHPQTFTLFH